MKQFLLAMNENRNILVVHNFKKVTLLTVYLSLQKFDIFCISEICLDFSVARADTNLGIPDLTRSNHPSNSRRRGTSGVKYCFYK